MIFDVPGEPLMAQKILHYYCMRRMPLIQQSSVPNGAHTTQGQVRGVCLRSWTAQRHRSTKTAPQPYGTASSERFVWSLMAVSPRTVFVDFFDFFSCFFRFFSVSKHICPLVHSQHGFLGNPLFSLRDSI